MPRPRAAPAGSPERLQKYLAQRGLGSRRAVEEWIRAQRLTVNGRIAELGVKVLPTDDIRLDPLREAEGDRAALIDRLPKTAGRRFVAVSPMPSIDGGLEIVTSDGALAAKLQRAVHGLTSEFTVRVKGLLGPDQIAGIESGKLDRATRMKVESLKSSEAQTEAANRWYTLVVRAASGKDVRQLFERQGALVSRVMRVSIGPIELDKALARGQYRQLDEEQIAALLARPAPSDDEAGAGGPARGE
jgi:23S rRNA pseudouridine2605 synthase